MNSLDIIRTNIQKLYEIDPHIHINVSLSKPKVLLENQPVVITGVYPHIFQIEERSSGSADSHPARSLKTQLPVMAGRNSRSLPDGIGGQKMTGNC